MRRRRRTRRAKHLARLLQERFRAGGPELDLHFAPLRPGRAADQDDRHRVVGEFGHDGSGCIGDGTNLPTRRQGGDSRQLLAHDRPAQYVGQLVGHDLRVAVAERKPDLGSRLLRRNLCVPTVVGVSGASPKGDSPTQQIVTGGVEVLADQFGVGLHRRAVGRNERGEGGELEVCIDIELVFALGL